MKNLLKSRRVNPAAFVYSATGEQRDVNNL